MLLAAYGWLVIRGGISSFLKLPPNLYPTSVGWAGKATCGSESAIVSGGLGVHAPESAAALPLLHPASSSAGSALHRERHQASPTPLTTSSTINSAAAPANGWPSSSLPPPLAQLAVVLIQAAWSIVLAARVGLAAACGLIYVQVEQLAAGGVAPTTMILAVATAAAAIDSTAGRTGAVWLLVFLVVTCYLSARLCLALFFLGFPSLRSCARLQTSEFGTG